MNRKSRKYQINKGRGSNEKAYKAGHFNRLLLIILFRITVFRGGLTTENLFQNGHITFDFFAGYLEMLRSNMFYEFFYLFVGNIIWFVPFGFLLPCINRRFSSFPQAVIFGFLLALLIEFLQFAFGTGISEADDLILNTLGTVLGYGAYKAMLRFRFK